MATELVVAISEAIADVEDVNPMDLDYTLQDFIPGDAIRMLEGRGHASWTLRFEIPEHVITVTGDGLIFVDGMQTISSMELEVIQ